MTRNNFIDNQNIDTNKENPLMAENDTSPAKTAFNLKNFLKDPKLKLLFGLSILLIVLLFLSIVALIFKKKPTVTSYTPTPTVILPTPTPDQSQIPEKWRSRLQDREAETRINQDFLPPQIDTNIGL